MFPRRSPSASPSFRDDGETKGLRRGNDRKVAIPKAFPNDRVAIE
ncbi:MAG: hypothetical protein RSA53_05005 [Odoribacter sp.]